MLITNLTEDQAAFLERVKQANNIKTNSEACDHVFKRYYNYRQEYLLCNAENEKLLMEFNSLKQVLSNIKKTMEAFTSIQNDIENVISKI